MPPITIDEIKGRREIECKKVYEALLDRIEQRSASLSEPNGHTTVINIPPRPEVLTVVSWNVQTFEAGKSLGNPFVNKVINRVLEALDADICILLESRADSYVNMNAIETRHEGTGGWKEAAEEGADDEDGGDDDPDDEASSPHGGIDEEAPEEDAPMGDGGGPLTYLQNASEMTGKLWVPPKVIHVYHPDSVAYCADIKLIQRLTTLKGKHDKSGALSKKDQRTYLTLEKRYDKKFADKDPILARALVAPPEAKRFASSYAFQPKLLKSLCVGELGATQDWLATLRSDEHTPTRAYFDLYYVREADWTEARVGWDTDISSVSVDCNWRFVLRLKRCSGCGDYLGVGACDACGELGPYTTNLQNLSQAVDEVAFYRCTCQESYSILIRPDASVLGSSAQGLWIKDKLVSAKTIAARLLMRGPDQLDPKDGKFLKAGPFLGYQDRKIGFYGRCPYLLPIELWLPYEDVSRNLYMVAFHGPFGASTKAGVELRADAMREVLEAGVGMGSKLDAEPHVMILGDFNLDWAPGAPKPDAYQKIAAGLYDGFVKKGLYPLIEGVGTSLISIHGQAKWKTVDPTTIESYTSSAYDNCFLRGDDVRAHVVTAAVIDVISWIEDNLGDFELPESDPHHDNPDALPPKTLAFYIYRKYVSDHLPIVCDILVAPMTPRMKALAKQAREERGADEEGMIMMVDSEPVRVSRVERVVQFTYEAMIAAGPTEGPDDYSREEGMDGTWTGTFVGVVDKHPDGRTILVCNLSSGDRAWLVTPDWKLGARVRFVVKNQRPVG